MTNFTMEFFHSQSLRCYKRIFLASVAVKAISLKLKGKHDAASNLIICLRMYYAATTDPLISGLEVKDLIYVCCTLLEKLHRYDELCQMFDTLMSECPAKLEPRKLSHLSRCQVRQNLTKCNVLLPAAIEQFCIPTRVKNFILGDLIDISQRKKFAICM